MGIIRKYFLSVLYVLFTPAKESRNVETPGVVPLSEIRLIFFGDIKNSTNVTTSLKP